jgi:hypothetical protein
MLLVFTFSFLNAQIEKPQKGTLIKKGLDVSKLKIKSLKDIKNLEIPVIDIPTNQYDLRPIRTWKITPNKKKDGNLRLYYFKGQQFENSWYINKYFTNLYPHSGLVPPELHRDIGLFHGTPLDGGGGLTPPLVLKFFASKNVTYMLKFKVENRQIYTNRKIAILIDNHISYVRLNSRSVFIYAFIPDATKEIKIGIGGLFSHRNTEFLKTSEIKIDQINR